jgi:uncharacterized phage-associated protein
MSSTILGIFASSGASASVGTFVAITHDNSPYISVYPWSAGFGTKLSNPATLKMAFFEFFCCVRVQSAPKISNAMHQILNRVQQTAGSWVKKVLHELLVLEF